MITPSGRKVTQAEREKKEENNAINSGHLDPWHRTQAAQTNRFI